jgi:formylglycine-generating enzyme required for sulfatase activity
MTNAPIRPRFRLLGAAALVACISMGSILSFAQEPTTPPQGEKLAPYVETLPKSVVKIQMLPIPGGNVTIGKKTVTVKPFYLAKNEMAWEAFDVFLASGPPSKAYDQTEFAADAVARPSKSYILPDLGWGHNGYPVINVSFTTVEMFCRWLSKETGKKYRLPTEAEWEIACRGGVTGPWKPLDKAALNKVAWYKDNSDEMTHPVGKKAPNKFGLYDIIGNAGEWATDLDGKPVLCGGTHSDTLAKSTPSERKRWTPKWQETDPQMPKSRWWLSDGMFCGFRIVCEP